MKTKNILTIFATSVVILNSTDSSYIDFLKKKNPSKFIFGGGDNTIIHNNENDNQNQKGINEKINEEPEEIRQEFLEKNPEGSGEKNGNYDTVITSNPVNQSWFLENFIRNINIDLISTSKEYFRIAINRNLLERVYFVRCLNKIFEKPKVVIIEDNFLNSPICDNSFYHILEKQNFTTCDPSVQLSPKQKFSRFMLSAFRYITFFNNPNSEKAIFISQFYYMLAKNLDGKLKEVAQKYVDINSEETKKLFMQQESNQEFFNSFVDVSDDIVTQKIMNIFIDSFSAFKQITDSMFKSDKQDNTNRYRVPRDDLHIDPYILETAKFNTPFIDKNNHPPYNSMFLFILQKMCFEYMEFVQTSHLDMLTEIYKIDFSEAIGDYMRQNICEKGNYKISFSRAKGKPYKMEVMQSSELDGTFFSRLMKILFEDRSYWIHSELYIDKSYESLESLVSKNEDKYMKLINLCSDRISNEAVILIVTTMSFAFNELNSLYGKDFSNVYSVSSSNNSNNELNSDSKGLSNKLNDNSNITSVSSVSEYINLENTLQIIMSMMDNKSENSSTFVSILINSFNFLLNENKKQCNVQISNCNVSSTKVVDYAVSKLKLDNVYSKVFLCITYVLYSFLKDIKLYEKIPAKEVSPFVNNKIKEHVLSFQCSKSLKSGSDTE